MSAVTKLCRFVTKIKVHRIGILGLRQNSKIHLRRKIKFFHAYPQTRARFAAFPQELKKQCI